MTASAAAADFLRFLYLTLGSFINIDIGFIENSLNPLGIFNCLSCPVALARSAEDALLFSDLPTGFILIDPRLS